MHFKSIGSRIVFSVVPIIAVTILLSVVLTSNVTYEQIDTQINEKMIESVQVASRDIQLELSKNANVTHNMVIYAMTAGLDAVFSDSFLAFARESISSNKNTVGGGIWYEPFRVRPEEKHVSIYAYRDGEQTAVTRNYADTLDYYDEIWYMDGKNSEGEIVWSDIYYDPVADVTMVTSTQPFYDGFGGMLGVTTADMALTDIKNIVKDVSVGESGTAFIVGKQGEYISFLDDSKGSHEKIQEDSNPALAALGAEILSHEAGVTSIELDGVRQSVYYDTLPQVGWKLVVLIQAEEIRASATQLVLLMTTVPVIGLALAVCAIMFIVRHLRRIINKVNAFADMAASGNLSERIEVLEYDEFGVMEDRLNQMIAKMSSMREELEEMLQVAQEADKAKGEFLSRMSHEIRTPINAIIGMNHIALKTKDPEKIMDCLTKSKAASAYLLSLVNDILDMAKIEENKMELHEEDIALKEIVDNVYSLIDVKALEKKQKLDVFYGEGVPEYIFADGMRLSQVLFNLLGNAVKFTPKGGRVSLHVEKEEETAEGMKLSFAVQDTGIGFSKEIEKKLFESFEQADGGIARKFGGTGLGLPISKAIVKLMGGKFKVKSEEGQGSTFTFTIRVLPGNPEVACEEAKEEKPLDLTGKTILLVEDVEMNRQIAIELLRETHATIEECVNGKEAVELFANDPTRYSLILMDIQMPEMDGFEATSRIRAMEGGADVPILALSANAFQTDVDESLAVGMNGHVSKPLNPPVLMDAIRRCIDTK